MSREIKSPELKDELSVGQNNAESRVVTFKEVLSFVNAVGDDMSVIMSTLHKQQIAINIMLKHDNSLGDAIAKVMTFVDEIYDGKYKDENIFKEALLQHNFADYVGDVVKEEYRVWKLQNI